MPIIDWFINYINTTPAEVIGADILIYFGWFPISAVVIWGLLQVWVDKKQGEFWHKLEWDLLAINIPADTIQSPKGIENIFINLSGSKSAITWKEEWLYGKFQAYFSFEIVSNGGQIQYYIRCVNKYRDLVEAAIYAQYPEAQIVEVEDYIDQIPDDFPNDEYDCFGSEFSMSEDEIFPIKRYKDFEHVGEKDIRFKDPILPILEVLGKMRPGEHFWIQLIIMGTSQDWRKKSVKWMKKMYGVEEKKKKGVIDEAVGWLPRGVMEQVGLSVGGEQEGQADDFKMWKLTPDERDALEAVKEKSVEIGWRSKIRVVYCARHETFRKGTAASSMKGLFNQFDSGINKLGLTASSTPKDDYFFQAWQMPGKQRKLVAKYKNRKFGAGTTPYILSASELATIWHFPAADARTPVLTSLGARMAEAPVELLYAPDEDVILPNIERSESDMTGVASELQKKIQTPPREPELPKPTVPTGSGFSTVIPTEVEGSLDETSRDSSIPKPGMPAPLPPGLDLSDQSMPEENLPKDLPV